MIKNVFCLFIVFDYYCATRFRCLKRGKKVENNEMTFYVGAASGEEDLSNKVIIKSNVSERGEQEERWLKTLQVIIDSLTRIGYFNKAMLGQWSSREETYTLN